MQLKNNLAVLANVGILALLACQSAMGLSLPAATTYAEHRETRAYAGLQWFIGETSVTKPKVVLGLRTTTTDLSNKVTGYDLSYTYSLESPPQTRSVPATWTKSAAGVATVGLSYSFKKETVLGFAGVVGSDAKAFGESDGRRILALAWNSIHCLAQANLKRPRGLFLFRPDRSDSI
jgi:hypothetical protein